MAPDFDQDIDRSGTHSLKFDARQQQFGSNDVRPLWVADMDFAAPACVTAALQARASHPVYGYTQYPPSLYQAIIEWFARRHHWQIEREWLVLAPGVLPSLSAVTQACTSVGDGVIVQPPVYAGFSAVIEGTRRQVVHNPLRETAGHYRIDVSHLERCAQAGARLLMLCSPHNPVGRVWSEGELRAILQVARQHDLTIVSDDIHADLAYSDATQFMLGRLAQPRDKIITAVSPGKTFNIQGLSLSALVIPHAEQRQAIQHTLESMQLGDGNPFNIAAFEAAYRGGDAWLDALTAYLEGTRNMVADYLHQYIPQVRLVAPQAGYLLWLDCRALGMDDDALRQFFIHRCQLGLNPGAPYGPGGSGFMRMNIGTPRRHVEAALMSIRNALNA